MNLSKFNKWLRLAAGVLLLCTPLGPVVAGHISSPDRTSWDNFFGANGFLRSYTKDGLPITDYEGSSDPTSGTAVGSDNVDLSSGSPTSDPGNEATALFGYYNGGTPYDSNDPSTMADDYIMFRMRVGGDPGSSTGFVSAHYNVLLDVDDDGYKEFWIDLEGSHASGSGHEERVQVLYDNSTSQLIDDADASRVAELAALSVIDAAGPGPDLADVFEDAGLDGTNCGNAADTPTAPAYSHARVLAVNCVDDSDNTGDYLIDIQIPMTAFTDLNGNQVLFPDSPVGFVYSTGNSNQDPLQKDWGHDLDPDGGTLNTADPIVFGDIVKPGGESQIDFIDASGQPASFYSIGDDILIRVIDPASNDDTGTNNLDTVVVTVENADTGETETVTLCESGEDTGIFTNNGGADNPDTTNSPDAFMSAVLTAAPVADGDVWTATYNGATWDVTSVAQGTQGTATAGTEFTATNGAVTFTIVEVNTPTNGDNITFNSCGADQLTTSLGTGGTDDDGNLEFQPGEIKVTTFTGATGEVTDSAAMLAAGAPFVEFTRATGLPNDLFFLDATVAASDPVHVQVTDVDAVLCVDDTACPSWCGVSDADCGTITCDVSGPDIVKVALSGTDGSGPGALCLDRQSAGVYRNDIALDAQIDTGGASTTIWEDNDKQVVTADYISVWDVGASSNTASFFTTNGGGVFFTHAPLTLDRDDYGDGAAVFLKIADLNACETAGTSPFPDYLTVTVTSATSGDSELVTLFETVAGSRIYTNTLDDLDTTALSADIDSTEALFSIVNTTDEFIVASGSDLGVFAVNTKTDSSNISLNETDDVTPASLTTTASGDPGLRWTRTSTGSPVAGTLHSLLTAECAGCTPVANDGVLEVDDGDTLTVTYSDCDDGDNLIGSNNDDKTDTATISISATRAQIGGFQAYRVRGIGTVVEWQTLSEHGSVGFDLLRLDTQSGQSTNYSPVNAELIPGMLHSVMGGVYRVVDTGVQAGSRQAYKLKEREAAGTEIEYGSYIVTVAETPPRNLSDPERTALRVGYSSSPRALSSHQRSRIAAGNRARAAAHARRAQRKAPAVKVAIREPGLYVLKATAIAGIFGETAGRIRQAIKSGGLRIHYRGEQVATVAGASSDALYFYAEGIDSVYTRDNIYWLSLGSGLHMGSSNAGRPRSVAGLTFEDTRHVAGNRYTVTHLLDDPDADYWMWDLRFENRFFPGIMLESFNVPSPGVADIATATATLTVRFQGASETDAILDHHATVMINGHAAGVAAWAGLNAYVAQFAVPVAWLNDGDNAIIVNGASAGVSGQFSVFYINDFELNYPRHYASVDDALEFDAAGHAVLTVGGFSDASVQVFDISNALRPKVLRNTLVSGSPGHYQASFKTDRGASRYLAISLEAAKAPAVAYADWPSTLKRRSLESDWMIITRGDMQAAAQRLADYREAQGLRSMVVDVEDVYDEFNHGIRSADAIWAFLQYTHRNWKSAPHYVVLAGEGSIDHKNDLGFGDSIVPSLLTPTPDGLFPSDNLYVDLAGAGRLPEIAIGRLPVIDAMELEAVVQKIIGYESSAGDWTKRVALAADFVDHAGDFRADSAAIANLVPDDYQVTRINAAKARGPKARSKFLEVFNAGQVFVNFYGHGGFLGLGNSDLLNAFDVPGLSNQQRLPVVTAFTCLAGQFWFQGQDSIGELLLLKPDGGAIAVWAPSGMSRDESAQVLGEGFYSATFSHGKRRVGDAILHAQRELARTGANDYLIDIYNLLGDPATVMK